MRPRVGLVVNLGLVGLGLGLRVRVRVRVMLVRVRAVDEGVAMFYSILRILLLHKIKNQPVTSSQFWSCNSSCKKLVRPKLKEKNINFVCVRFRVSCLQCCSVTCKPFSDRNLWLEVYLVL